MQRLTDERGAVGVMVALLMVPLIGFAAISIDVSAMWSEKQQLQNGADAGALAVAQDCARGDCGDSTGTAQSLATANVEAGDATASVGSAGASQVSVTTSGVREHWFAPVLGINSSTIVADASAAWGFPTGGTAQLPLAISWCDFQAQTGGGPPSGDAISTIPLTEDPAPVPVEVPEEPATPEPPVEEDPAAPPVTPDVAPSPPEEPDTSCAGPRGTSVRGGFGWLVAASGCEAGSSIGAGAGGAAGGSVSSGCSAAGFAALQGRTVLLPIFDQYDGLNGAGQYRVHGYAAFTLTGYHFAGRFGWRDPCGGSDSCIAGSFTRSVDLSDRFDYNDDAPQLGAAVVSLTS